MKKHIYSLFIRFLCVVCLGFLSACGDDNLSESFSLVYETSEAGRTFELQVDPPSCPCTIVKAYVNGEQNWQNILNYDGGGLEKAIPVLKRKIKKSGFMKLPQDKPSEAHPSDGKVRTLHVKLNGKECRVTVSGDDAPEAFLRAETAVREFLTPLDQ